MKVTPTSATSARPLRPFGAFFPGGGPFESTIGSSEEHTSELQSRGNLVCRLLLEKNKHVLRVHDGSWLMAASSDPSKGAVSAHRAVVAFASRCSEHQSRTQANEFFF